MAPTIILHIFALALICAGIMLPSADARAGTVPDITEMSIEDLMSIEVTSVSKRPHKASKSAAAVYVITAEDIRRSGATSIPEALRMVPGVQVGRVDANKWAITSRGFNGVFANKLLVLMDGRTVYTPTFSGVYWDVQDTMLEDIDRIEVIRGPGATLWGANAVNGVINIITKHSRQTAGGLLSAGAGTEERGFGSARYGASLGSGASARVYVKYFDRDESIFGNGAEAHDDWRALRGGFRVDWDATVDDAFTVHGDIYTGDAGGTFQRLSLMPPYLNIMTGDGTLSGGNVLCRWSHAISPGSELSVQAYYDRLRHGIVLFDETRDTLDVEAQHSFGLFGFNRIVWGLGYHYTADTIKGTFELSVSPESSQDQLFSAFIQDEISVIEDRLNLIVGSKFEHNDYTGFEVQPSAKLILTPNDDHTVWASVSRAVRTPSRGEHSSRVATTIIPPGTPGNPGPLPLDVDFRGSSDFCSEKVISCELGYRAMLSEVFSLDTALFFNDFDDQRAGVNGAPVLVLAPVPHLVIPVRPVNNLDGEAYGAEVSADLRLTDWWLVQASYSYLKMEFHSEGARTSKQTELSAEGGSPQNQFSIRSKTDLPYDIEFDAWLRYVDRVKDISVTGADGDVKGYATLDLRIGWEPVDGLELSLAGQNLLDNSHPEYVPELLIVPTEVQRSVYGKITWRTP